MRKKLNIDLEVLKDMSVGISDIAYTADPAIEIIGLSFNKNRRSHLFNKDNRKKLIFGDEKKLRISGPVMLVKDIYRYDASNKEEYDLIFDYDTNKALVDQFKSKITTLNKESIFNDEHFEDKRINAFIINMIFIESQSEIDYIKDKFNYDLELGDVWMDTQVKDIDTYNYLVEEKKIGFSIEGFFKLNEIIEKQIKNNKDKLMKKVKFKFRKKGKFSTPSEITIVGEQTEDLKGTELEIVGEDGGVIEDWSGEITILDEVTDELVDVIVENDIIKEIVDEKLLEEEIKEEDLEDIKEEIKEEDLDDFRPIKEGDLDNIKEGIKEEDLEEVPTESTLEADVKGIMKEDIDSILKMIADLESKISDKDVKVEEEAEFSEEEEEKEKFRRSLSGMIGKKSKR